MQTLAFQRIGTMVTVTRKANGLVVVVVVVVVCWCWPGVSECGNTFITTIAAT